MCDVEMRSFVLEMKGFFRVFLVYFLEAPSRARDLSLVIRQG
jgi:hypothetical protein